MTGGQTPDPRYVAARRILLDALTALVPHRDAVIVVGAQAIYLHTGSMSLDESIAPYTTDGDLAVNPSLLGDDPHLEAAMESAGFELKHNPGGALEPGIWVAQTKIEDITYDVPVDLIVPEGAAPPGGRRAARLGPHGARAARRAVGLEAALVDHVTMRISALEPGDQRSIQAEVAGVAAMFVAKAHKIHDRAELEHSDRLNDKDAADVIRLMQTTRPQDVGVTMTELVANTSTSEVTRHALLYLIDLFGRRNGAGVQMAVRAMQVALPSERVEAISVAYMSAIRGAVGHGGTDD